MTRDPPDDALMEYARGGSTDAFAQLYDRYRLDVWNLAFFKLHNHHEAEDSVQETFLKAYRALGQYRLHGSVRPWLLTICRNVCIDRARANGRNGTLSLESGARGAIRPLEPLVGDLVERNYGAPWRRLGSVDGALYGVWFKAADKSTVRYSRRAFERAGIAAPPADWEELLRDAEALRATGMVPFSLAGGEGWTLTDWFENLYLQDAGPDRYERLAAHELPWTDPSVKHALRRLATIFGDPRLVGPRDRLLDVTFPESVARMFGPRPTAAMVVEGSFVRPFLPGAPDAAGVFGFPSSRAAAASEPVVGGDIAVEFTRRDGADELLPFLASPGAAEPWAQAGGFISPNRAVPARVSPDALTRDAAASIAGATTIRFDLSDRQPPAFGATYGQGMWELFRDFLREPGDVDGLARRLEEAAAAADGRRD